MSPSLCSRCAVDPSVTVFLGHQSWVFQVCSLNGYVCPPVVIETWLLFRCQLEGFILILVGYEDWPVRGWLYRGGFALAKLWYLSNLFYQCVVL